MKGVRVMKNHLNDNFYKIPQFSSKVMTKEQLRETLLTTSGWITANGEIWDIKNDHLGADIYKVYLKKR